ncbi:MAG: hypothetical protein V4805_05840 [Pseudomonadota bacterium]
MTTTTSCTSCAIPSETEVESQAIALLNSECFCISMEEGAIKQALKKDFAAADVFDLIEERCPYVFSARPVFVGASQAAAMAQLVRAIESVVALPAYQDKVLANAPAIAQHAPRGAKGVFFGYDFHLHKDGIGLIEINTNAGGAMLNAVLARAQHVCCDGMDAMVLSTATAAAFEKSIVDMFLSEWNLSGRNKPLRTIAIVDETPQQQYLYPEFLLFQQLFQRHGMAAIIVDPAQLHWSEGVLWHGTTAIDLVYNRLTDFMLASPSSAALRSAYLAHAVVLTPHPQAHALYADKRNLALLSDPLQLQALGVPAETQALLLKYIPHTEVVQAEHAERLWQERRRLFFKPTAGYGGRAAYRGDKLTKRVWDDILAGDYIAQAIVAPGERINGTVENPERMKFDIRSYTYDGAVQWTAARVYQGQTTNFRTPGGGFAPVYSIADGAAASLERLPL